MVIFKLKIKHQKGVRIMLHQPKKSIVHPDIHSGSLLISTPVNIKFKNSKLLVLITEHNEEGTTGIILNKQLASNRITKRVYGSSEPVEVQYGGPDNFDMESFLIVYPSFKNGWLDSAFWSYDNLDIIIILHFLAEYNMRIGAFQGCIKWKPGELERDLEEGLFWFTNDYQITTVLQPGSFAWKSYAKRFGGFYADLVDEDIPVIYN